MFQCILTVAGSEFHFTQKSYNFRMKTVNTCFQSGIFAFLLHLIVHFLLCLLNRLFDSCRMNTTIHNQLLKSNPRNLSANRVKTGNHNCLRGIVNNQIYAGQCLQRTDISSFSTDDSALHLIIRKLYDRNGGFRNMVGGTALDGIDHDFLGFLIRSLFGLCF